MFSSRRGKDRVRATDGPDGSQVATVLVKAGYTPATIVAEWGKPVRITFLREEASPCSETVVFERLAARAALPEGVPVTVEVTPETPGSYAFSCDMGMYRGTLVVE